MCLVNDSDGYLVLLEERHNRAKKPHKCTECNRVIGAGEVYLLEKAILDGDFETYKTCAHCQVARAWLMVECGGWLYRGVYEDIAEHVSDGKGTAAVRLLIGMRRKWGKKDGALMRVPRRS